MEERLLDAGPKELLVGDRSNGFPRSGRRPGEATSTPEALVDLGFGQARRSPPLAAAGALAFYDPRIPRWAAHGDKVAQSLLTVNFIYLKDWLDHFVRSVLS